MKNAFTASIKEANAFDIIIGTGGMNRKGKQEILGLKGQKNLSVSAAPNEWILQLYNLCIIMQMIAEKCKTGVKSGLRAHIAKADRTDMYYDQYEET